MLAAKRHLFTGTVSVVFALSARYAAPTAQSSYCDQNVKPIAAKTGYGPRSGRCEGFHIVQMSALTDLALVGVEKRGMRQEPENTVTALWDSSGLEGDLSLRIQQVAKGYRLDTRVKGADGRYEWPSTMIRDANLSVNTLDAVMSRPETIRGATVQVSIPIFLNPPTPAPNMDDLYVVLVCPETLQKLTYRVTRLESQPAKDRIVLAPREFKTPPFPAGERMLIRMSLQGPGVYRIDFVGEPNRSASVFVRIP
jgi:hypothetical protein